MSSFHVDTSFNSLTITSTSTVSTTSTTTTNRRLLDVDSNRLSVTNSPNSNLANTNIHQRRTSIVNHHQRRNSQLRKSSFTTSTLSLAVTDEEAGDLSAARLSISNSLTSVHKQCEHDDAEATNKLLEIGRVASWAVGFEKLLNDEMGLYVFTEFLKKEFSQENIQFWIACEKFKKLSDPDEIRHHANLIWSTYLHDTDDGSCPINIDSRTRQDCQQSLLNKPNSHMFEKAQAQIFQLMKYDSYTRFLKSNMYKDCIMNEMEGKSIPFFKHQYQPPISPNADDRARALDSLTKLKDDEKKDKKRSPLLPWTKAFIKWKRLSVKRDTPSSLSNLHHQTANASTNTPIHETSCLTSFLTSPIANKSASTELGAIINPTKTISSSSTSLTNTANSGSLANKLNKLSSNPNPQDSSAYTFNLRTEINQDTTASIEKRTLSENPSTSSIDISRFCRFIFPDQTIAMLLTYNCTNQPIQQAINRLFAKRGITWYRTELYLVSSNEQQQPIDIQETLSTLSGKEIRVELRILIRIDFPMKTLCVRSDPKRTLLQVLQPIVDKLKLSIGQFVFYANDLLIPLNLNEAVSNYDNQRIFALTKTASGVDMSSRQKFKVMNDIFEMISENDDDIKFDECGILKPVTLSKSTIVVSNDDYPHSPTPESTSPCDSDQIHRGPPKR